MGKIIRKRDGRSTDLTFSWLLTTHGDEWLQWQQYASEWMLSQHRSVHTRRNALTHFFETYLLDYAPYAIDVNLFFKGKNGHHCNTEEYIKVLNNVGVSEGSNRAIQTNYTVDFIDWLIAEHLSIPDKADGKTPLIINPLTKVKVIRSHNETVRNPLPYRYIEDLRQIISSIPIKGKKSRKENFHPIWTGYHFKDWQWAQQQTGQPEKSGRYNINSGDWFEIDSELVDKDDPDCVWRTIDVNRKGNKTQIYQLWSPVKALALFMKLHLPLRTYQVRMLDSGEADTWRYESGDWVVNNKHDFTLGNEKRAFAKGVFKRIYDSMTNTFSTGLYVNTNKTADQNKDELDRGYTIPWEHEEVLYWLEKLRNWQEKYNPIIAPTDCTTLRRKHSSIQKSKQALREMGQICFLFRNPADPDESERNKPISDSPLSCLWHSMLAELENQLHSKGVTLKNGERLKLVKNLNDDENESISYATEYPLHSLRVSLITAYTMETNLPLPVISKLLAGHTRLLMTIYYNKITPSVMAEKMREANGQLHAKELLSVKAFIQDASLEQIQCKMAYHDEGSINAALVNRNPIGWENRACGICLVGGNTVKSDELSTCGGCWNGGEQVKAGTAAINRVFGPVPNGPENCVRCRWFITEAHYLPALNAQFNQLSYKAHQAASLAVAIEGELEELKDEQFFAEEKGCPFNELEALQVLQRRYEKQIVEADEYTKDWLATFKLINRIISIEERRNEGDRKDKLVAVGSQGDISHSIKFIETDSELLHLSLLCEDAEFYPDLLDDLCKTPAIEKRSRQLSRILMRKGFDPIFMEMDDKQQLIAGNAMLRKMAKIADPEDKLEGYRKATSYLETGEYLQDHKLLQTGLSALTHQSICLNTLMLEK